MFSFRTTPISEQLDRSLTEGRVACFCTQNCWDSATQTYLYDIFRKRGNLVRVFGPSGAELDPAAGHIDFSAEDLEGLDAVVVEIQDVGARYFGYTRDVLRLLSSVPVWRKVRRFISWTISILRDGWSKERSRCWSPTCGLLKWLTVTDLRWRSSATSGAVRSGRDSPFT
jgi:hypothetical protein